MQGSISDAGRWEDAYLRFESSGQERAKFRRRLLRLGAGTWPRDSAIVELCCGRGNGLVALAGLGFTNVEGLDLSPTLAAQYAGPGIVTVGDCRSLPYPNESRDVLIVQGGLHHLLELPADLDRTLDEAKRVLRPNGRFLAVEPWLTPFLRFVHAVCTLRAARALSRRIDALATMIECEGVTYRQWLGRPQMILTRLQSFFPDARFEIGWGKIFFVGVRAEGCTDKVCD